MKTNREIRKEAWGIVRGKWFWRIFLAGGALYLISFTVSGLLLAVYGNMEIPTWAAFLEAKLEHMRHGLGYAVPSTAAAWKMTGATLFQQFVGYLFGAICLFGLATLLLKATRDDGQDWFASAFGGFRRPFGVLWLLVLMNILIFLWSLLLIIPGIIAIYRYRQAWYLKSEHPDWGAWKSIDESCRMMYGRKWQAFALDFSFLVWLFLGGMVFAITLGIGIAFARSNALLPSAAGSLASLLGVCFFVFVVCYLFVARAVFYRELAEETVAEPAQEMV